jgi:hypothetical protein
MEIGKLKGDKRSPMELKELLERPERIRITHDDKWMYMNGSDFVVCQRKYQAKKTKELYRGGSEALAIAELIRE